MASIIQVGKKWRAQVRRKGNPTQTKTFSTKALAKAWADRIEATVEAVSAGALPSGKHAITVGALIDRYRDEVGKVKPLGRNKADVLRLMRLHLEKLDVRELTPDRIVTYVTDERRVSGVTATVDLVYLKGILRVARALWRLPVQPGVVDEARDILRYMGQLHRSNERDRRPTQDELDRLREWFARSATLTPDMLDFIVASCFRPPSEIVRLRWSDLNVEDRTIVIHDRKDPRRKLGNHQTVPLLGDAFDIVMRQPRRPGEDRIFPVNGHSWSSLFPRACKELGIVGLKLYDLRHEAASRLIESGKYSIPEVMLTGGWKDPKQLMRYVQLKAKNLHKQPPRPADNPTPGAAGPKE